MKNITFAFTRSSGARRGWAIRLKDRTHSMKSERFPYKAQHELSDKVKM